jgi:hypothetical protein
MKKDNRDQSSSTPEFSFLTSLDIESLRLDLSIIYTARTRILLEDNQDSSLEGFDIAHSYIYIY